MTNIDTSKLIFCTGAPGSRWSAIIRQLSEFPLVDNSDCNSVRQYSNARHFGNYFGPGMEFGDEFYDLSQANVTHLLLELAKPYTKSYGAGFRLIKSHFFSYNLPLLDELFPASRKLLIWRDNVECLSHWLNVGGFSITYPIYSWYRNEEMMARQIAIENSCIQDYVEQVGKPLRAMSLQEAARLLHLIEPEDQISVDWNPPLRDVLLSIC